MEKIPYIYFISISLVTLIATVYDKICAKGEKKRVPEKNLFILALLGGSLSEYLTMVAIRHKTLHKRFMIGLPCIMLLQLALLILAVIYL